MLPQEIAQHAGVADAPFGNDEAVRILEARVPGDGLVAAERTRKVEIE